MPQDLNFDFGSYPKPKPAASRTPPETRPQSGGLNFNFGSYPTASQPESTPSEEGFIDKVSRYATQSVSKTALGVDIGDFYDRTIKALNSALPKEHQGAYATRLVEGFGRAVPETADFFMSPAGMGLAAMHIIPATLPLAVGLDFIYGGYQALKTIPSVIDAARDYQDPDKVSQAFKDIAYTVMAHRGTRMAGKKGGLGGKLLERPTDMVKLTENLLQADPIDKLKFIDAHTNPQTPAEARNNWLHQAPFFSTMSKILDVPKPKLMEAGAYQVEVRNNFIEAAKLRVAKLAYDFRQEVPAEERTIQKMGYVIEGSATADEVGLSPAARKWVGRIRQWNNEVEQMFRDAYGDDVKLRDSETYLMHKWGFDLPGEFQAENNFNGLGAGRRVMRDPFLRQRVIESYKIGIEEHGLKPKFDDVATLLTARNEIAATAIANQRFANIMTQMGLVISENEFHKAARSKDEGTRGTVKGWEKLDSKPLERSVYAGHRPDGEAIFKTRPVYAHPHVKAPIEAILGDGPKFRDPDTGKLTWLGRMEYLRAYGKKNALGFSFFHPWAISEQAQAIQIGTRKVRGLGGAFKSTYLFNPDYYKGLKSGLWEIRGKGTPHAPPVLGLRYEASLNAVEHGLRLGTADAERTIANVMRNKRFESPSIDKTVGRLARGIGNVHYVMDRGLWDFYLPGQMLHAYETIVTRELAIKPREGEALSALKHEAAKHVNKVFGTESLESMLLSPRARTIANFALMAPVWTFSNFRVLTNGFQSEAGHRLTGRWLGGAMFTWFVTSNLANLATTGWIYSGKDGPAPDKNGVNRAHFMWDNPGNPIEVGGRFTRGITENSIRIFSGYNPDGTENYIGFGKAYTEIAMAFNDLYSYLTGKIGLLPKAAMAIITGHEPGSGFPVIDLNATRGERAAQVGMVALDSGVVPFIGQDLKNRIERAVLPEIVHEPAATQAYIPHTKIPLGQPTRKGDSTTRALSNYIEAMRKHDDKTADFILDQAEMNHIPRGRVLSLYRRYMNNRARTAEGPRRTYDVYGGELPPEPR